MGLTDEIWQQAGNPTPLFRPQGCSACQGTGYQGRTGIYELMLVDDDIRQLILKSVDSTTIKRAAVAARDAHPPAARRVQGGARHHHRGRGPLGHRGGPPMTAARGSLAGGARPAAGRRTRCRSSSTGRSPRPARRCRGSARRTPRRRCAATLRREGVFLTEVVGQKQADAQAAREVNVRRWVLGRISAEDLAIATRQLAVLVHAGIPLVEALTALVEQVEKEKLKRVLGDVKQRVNEGSVARRRARRPPARLRRRSTST